MNYFERAQNTDASGSTFNQVGRDQVQIIVQNAPSTASVLETLLPHTVLDATFDSSQREHVHSCLPDTRTDVLRTIMGRVEKDDGFPIYWLSGPAGSGKSTIAQTIAEECRDKGKLAASFFFSRGEALRNNTARFFPTVAYQLAVSVPSTGLSMQRAFEKDPSIPNKKLEEQFQRLILDPMVTLKPDISPMVVIVDALDECEDKNGIVKLIKIIVDALQKRPFHLWFIFTSRADEHIEAKFEELTTQPRTRRLALETWKAHADIRMFLRLRFQEIRHNKRRIMQGIPEPWPPTSDLDRLVEKSEGLFIWASTLVKFVDGSCLPHKTLQSALQMHIGLDPLYRQVFASSPRDGPFESVIGTIILLRTPLAVDQLALLLGLGADEIRGSLVGLQPILMIPDTNEEAIQPYHASLHDFLTDSHRSQDLFVNPAIHHTSILLSCFKVINNNLKDNQIRDRVTDYACMSWPNHLSRAVSHGAGNHLLLQSKDLLIGTVEKLAGDWFRIWVQDSYYVFFSGDLELTVTKLKLLGTSPDGENPKTQLEPSLVTSRDDLIVRLNFLIVRLMIDDFEESVRDLVGLKICC